MTLVMHRGSTAAQKTPVDWEDQVLLLNQCLAYLRDHYKIPKSLVVNWDQTAIELCPVSGSSRAERGVQSVPLLAKEDKCQVTAVFAAAADCTLLPPQLVFGGKTKQSLPLDYFDTYFHEQRPPPLQTC